MKNIAVFASGKGSNFLNIINQKDIDANFSLLISDKPEANAINIAIEHNIETFVFNPKKHINIRDFEKELEIILKDRNINIIILAGYMRILSPEFVNKFKNKIINIHPSMLPLYKGKNAIKQSFEDGKKIYGATVHFVTSELDSGEIIIQKQLKNYEGLNLEEITEKIHEIEYEIYPIAIKKIMEVY